jgi:DNA-binding NarL/FixJ family response regulator
MQRRTPGGRPAGVKPPRVVIADDHPPTRTGVRLALENGGFIVCAEEETGPGAVAAALRDPPDVCLLDVDMPGGGIEAAETIHAQLPETQVVMLSAAENDHDLFAALEAGASGYLLKEMDPARLGPALHGVLRGEAALPRTLTAHLIAEFRARARRPSLTRRSEKDLTSREWEVLDCLAEGLSTRRIAKRLFISETTVRRHVGSILRKLDAPSRQAAVEIVAQRSRNLNGE